MNVKEELEKRLTAAVLAYAKIPILIGPKWLCEGPKKGKLSFQYQGAPKVAKALGRNLERTVHGILKNLDLSDLNFEARSSADGVIHIFEKKTKEEQKVKEEKKESSKDDES